MRARVKLMSKSCFLQTFRKYANLNSQGALSVWGKSQWGGSHLLSESKLCHHSRRLANLFYGIWMVMRCLLFLSLRQTDLAPKGLRLNSSMLLVKVTCHLQIWVWKTEYSKSMSSGTKLRQDKKKWNTQFKNTEGE